MRSEVSWRRLWMLSGFASALAGDWFLAIRGAPRTSAGFLAGVICFTAAHAMWLAGQLREARPDARTFLAAAIPLSLFAGVRLFPVLPPAAGMAICLYALASALSFSTALATRRVFYALGIGLLLFSDLLVGGGLLHVPGCHLLSGPAYLVAEACLLVSFFWRDERRFAALRHDIWPGTVRAGAAMLLFFVLAAVLYPGGYNPLMRMLSALGRTEVKMVAYPWSHYLFMAGMAMAVLAASRTWLHLVQGRASGWRGAALAWGAAVNVAGLCAIALVPEDASMVVHNLGCHLAALGGAGVLVACDRPGRERAWTCVLVSIAGLFCANLVLHGLGAIPFVPWTTALQKVLIASFAIWIVDLARHARSAPLGRGTRILLALMAAVACIAMAIPFLGGKGMEMTGRETICHADTPRPFTAEEQMALKWLEHVTGPLSEADEKKWWAIGGRQFGIFAKRYNIAFCGYAAAALALRGDEAVRMRAGRILGNCIVRYLARDVWAYSMSKSYWGRKPWAPDPCYRENVMYTGHLLQLLALYETFTGDKRYWTDGFDFVWSDGRRVHYTVKKLIDVTVAQMRKGPNGGVACEPGLVFFPCNNHPHFALALFARLGHGDWTGDARRWEEWALSHYVNPLFGGGLFNLVCHVRSGLFYPRGHSGLDGWSLLWYEPWASERGRVLALWRDAANRIDWTALETGPDAREGCLSCCDPVDAPPVATAAFLAAAARACDDHSTAERLEALVARHLARQDGRMFLDVGRDWRIGSTANWIISRAEANGMRFRDMLRR